MKYMVWVAGEWSAERDGFEKNAVTAVGTCSYSDKNGVVLDIPCGDISQSRALASNGCYFETTSPQHYNRIEGMTQDGYHIVLRDVSSSGVGMSVSGATKERFRASVAYASKIEYDEEKLIERAEIEVYGLWEWLGLRLQLQRPDGTYEVSNRQADEAIPIFEGEQFSISIKYGHSRPVLCSNAMNVKGYALFEVACSTGMNLNRLWHDAVWRIQSLCSFFYGFYPSIESVKIWFEDGHGPVNVFRQTYVANNGRLNESFIPVAYTSLGDDGLRTFTSFWFTMDSEERRSTEILTALLGGWVMPLELPLTAASAMIEALGRKNDKKLYDSRAEFRRTVDPIVKAAPEDLQGRVRTLLGQLNSCSYLMRLNSIHGECGAFAKSVIPDWESFATRQRDIRNNGAHALDGEGGIEAQVDHYYALILLAYYVLLKRSKVEESVLACYEKSLFLDEARRRLVKRYPSDDEDDTAEPADQNAGSSERQQTILGFWKENESLGCCSNWHHSGFDFNGIHYATSEHWMMWQKARVMGDEVMAAKILKADTPRAAKDLGAKVSPYDGKLWEAVREQLVYYGAREKFLQNDLERNQLLSTGSAILAEASPYDKVWGVGMTADDPDFQDPTRWKGSNLLGRVCMRVRADLRQDDIQDKLDVSVIHDFLLSSTGRMTLLQLSRHPNARAAVCTYGRIAQYLSGTHYTLDAWMENVQIPIRDMAGSIEQGNWLLTEVAWQETLAELAFLYNTGRL